MVQINILSILDFGKKYLGWIIAIILFLMIFNCNGDSDHLEIIKQRDAKNKELNIKIDSLQKANKSKDKIIAKSEQKVLEKERIIEKLKIEIAEEKAKGKKKIAEQSKYNLKDWKKYYQEKTNFDDKDIFITNNTLNFTREPLIAIGKGLVQLDVVKAELKINSQVLVETQNIIIEKNTIIKNQSEKLVNLSGALTIKDEFADNLEKNIVDLKKDLKKASKPKLKTIVISAIAGIITGVIITK